MSALLDAAALVEAANRGTAEPPLEDLQSALRTLIEHARRTPAATNARADLLTLLAIASGHAPPCPEQSVSCRAYAVYRLVRGTRNGVTWWGMYGDCSEDRADAARLLSPSMVRLVRDWMRGHGYRTTIVKVTICVRRT